MPRELILANPTPDESRQTWTCTHPLWGAALSLDGYILRETRQADLPLARDGGLRPWVLVEADSKPDSRDILSSCETLRKRALVRRPDGEVSEVIAHGVASVFTAPAFRGKGHAGTMMARLGEALQAEGALLSVLWSDIGKEFYNKHGWRPFESDHLEFPVPAQEKEDEDPSPRPASVTIVRYDEIPQLASSDERLIRRAIARPPASPGKTTRVAILPDAATLQWHVLRDAAQCENILGRTPTSHGAVYTTPSGARVWAIWRRNHSAPPSQPEKNTFYILRLVVEDEDEDEATVPDDELGAALGAIVAAAKSEARDWACRDGAPVESRAEGAQPRGGERKARGQVREPGERQRHQSSLVRRRGCRQRGVARQ
uniref:N-acetyltransferase domain-containing protein n=1 Tax=Bionectria ochroleuca TaxID=29856 RepID=A0A8H7TVJ0_BIOOC